MMVSAFTILLFVLPSLAQPLDDRTDHCRCVPHQWEGIISSTDREFDLKGGQSGSADSNLHVHYDFKNKRFAMTDLKTGSRAIADYEQGYKYLIRGSECRRIRTREVMRQMCLPETAEFVGEFDLGTTVPVELWEFSGPFNTTMKTSVHRDDCVPISEEIYTGKGAYISLTTSVYLNVKLGIKDKDVFLPPDDCSVDRPDVRRMYQRGQKRSYKDQASELLKALRQRLYILN